MNKNVFGNDLPKEIKNIRLGDWVTLKPYHEVIREGWISVEITEDRYNNFINGPVKVISMDEYDFVALNVELSMTMEISKEAIKSIIDKKELSSLVHHPDHYNQNGMEVWDVIKAFTSNLSGAEAFYAGNAIKYILRWDKKNGIEDLEKAKVYIDKIIEGRKDTQN